MQILTVNSAYQQKNPVLSNNDESSPTTTNGCHPAPEDPAHTLILFFTATSIHIPVVLHVNIT